MKKNLGTRGRLIRFVMSLLLFVLAWRNQSLLLFGAALFTLYEALASWCVIYQLLGINHCPLDKK